MKKTLCAAVVAIVLPTALLAYDNSPSCYQVFPECVWAAATGGGTWVSEVQITNHTASTISVYGYYFYATGHRFAVPLPFGLEANRTYKYTNILATLQSMDPGFAYYGTSSCLALFTQVEANIISAVIRISNGNFGKTSPGLAWVDSNTANVGRDMKIPNIMLSPTYRTFTGFWNGHWTAGAMTVRFYVMNDDGTYAGNSWDESFGQWQFKVFNPFTKAGLAGTYDNHWLKVVPLTSTTSGAGTRGLFCFGSIANNVSNDTYGLMATQFQ